MKKVLYIIFVLLLTSSPAYSAKASPSSIYSKTIDYKDGNTVLEGYVAYDKSIKGKRPAVLIVHDWMGHGEFVEEKARQLAKLGYVAFAADIYGKNIRPKNNDEAAKLAGMYKNDRNLLRRRIKTALHYLHSIQHTDPQRIAAIGYCFGGMTVLELARSGEEIAGVVSIHGSLDTPESSNSNIKTKVLVLHGADDPFTPPEIMSAFEDEMRHDSVDWQMVLYGNAVHSFTNPAAGNDNSKGVAYNEKADKRSWTALMDFFKEIFSTK
ncbi:dienelactone hydrolase family protein [Candidatus Magnetomonas plexicatena]|uniref:dienelactone hydrolase family protein n=1 Tax=Candidatus Magnetomonas plexicatena TaxID=2552947 RepID=UPI0010FFD7EE|nr:dienelactone hydrolase family protein [Nitrospirales bacterium LBB_01]